MVQTERKTHNLGQNGTPGLQPAAVAVVVAVVVAMAAVVAVVAAMVVAAER